MTLSRDDLLGFAAASGFAPDTLEKVLRLADLLGSIASHPFLRPRLALKGGTALNLFVLDVPRLSVDIDLNYIGTADRDAMLAERGLLEQAIRSACQRSDLAVKHIPAEHAGGLWRLSYRAVSSETATIQLDLNYLLRTPLWPTLALETHPLPGLVPVTFPVLDLHELAAGKLAALLARRASRDVFDARELLRLGTLDPAKLRLAFVVYGAANRVDWRTVDAAAVTVSSRDSAEHLFPMLRTDLVPARTEGAAWTAALVAECQELLGAVLPLTLEERAFLDAINDRGEIAPHLLTADPRLRAVIANHPALAWKAQNVRKHHGLDAQPPLVAP